jgi:hypothetical protein
MAQGKRQKVEGGRYKVEGRRKRYRVKGIR